MRLDIVLRSKKEVQQRLCENLHLVQAGIYGAMSPHLSERLHGKGFTAQKRTYRLISFSWPVVLRGGQIELSITTPLREICDDLRSRLPLHGIRFGSAEYVCDSVEESRAVLIGDKITVRTLSPVTCQWTSLRSDRKHAVFPEPGSPEWHDLAVGNLVRKHEAATGAAVSADAVAIVPLTTRGQVVSFRVEKSHPVTCWWGEYAISAPRDLLETALDCGLGARNSAGFGCLILSEHYDRRCAAGWA